jgi:peptide/nickel transport system substrate-binding protein
LKKSWKIFQKRLFALPRYLSRTEKIAILILSLIAVASVWIGGKKHTPKGFISNFSNTFTEGTTGEIRCLIPILKQNDLEKDISRLLFASLVQFNNKREVIPDLAEKWEISPDGKNYTFYLREAHWQDGQDITADDVVFTFSQIKNEKTQSPYFDAFAKVKVEKQDQKTIRFILEKPCATFLTSLNIPILPQHSFASNERLVDSSFTKKPLASGPFTLDKIEQNKEIITVILKANQYYFNGKPALDKFIFNVYPSEEAAVDAFNRGVVDALFSDKTLQGQSVNIALPNSKMVIFNLEKPYLTKEVRKALAYAVNRDELLAANILGAKIYYPILPGFLGYKESERYDFNLEKAKKSLEKTRNKPQKLILQTPSTPNDQKIAEILKTQWEKLGIEIEIAPNSSDNFDLLLLGINQKADPDPYPFWHSSQTQNNGLNFAYYGNKQVDKLLEEARQTLDPGIRQQKYEKFIDLFQDDLPAIFLYQGLNKYYFSGKIRGIEDVLGVTRADRFYNITAWNIK